MIPVLWSEVGPAPLARPPEDIPRYSYQVHVTKLGERTYAAVDRETDKLVSGWFDDHSYAAKIAALMNAGLSP